MDEKDKEDLEALRAFAEEASNRKKSDDETSTVAALFAFTWVGTAGIFLLFVWKFEFHSPWYLVILIPTILGFTVVRLEKHFRNSRK